MTLSDAKALQPGDRVRYNALRLTWEVLGVAWFEDVAGEHINITAKRQSPGREDKIELLDDPYVLTKIYT